MYIYIVNEPLFRGYGKDGYEDVKKTILLEEHGVTITKLSIQSYLVNIQL